MVTVPTSLNNLKTKLDGIDVDKLRTVPVGLSEVVNSELC